MGNVNSRVPQKLPESLLVALASAGWVHTPVSTPSGQVLRSNSHSFRHPKLPGQVVRIAPMNLPGSTEVLATLPDMPPQPIDLDVLIQRIAELVTPANTIQRPMQAPGIYTKD